MIALKKATLEQIVAELRSRPNLEFALVALRFGAFESANIFSSSDLNVFAVTRLLTAAAQDILEGLEAEIDEADPPPEPAVIRGPGLLRRPEKQCRSNRAMRRGNPQRA